MLPIILPQTGEFLRLDNSMNNMELLPESAVTPDAGFNDLLQLRLDELPTVQIEPGDGLPVSGNELPLDAEIAPLSGDVLALTGGELEELPKPELPASAARTDVAIEMPGIELMETPLTDALPPVPETGELVVPPTPVPVAPLPAESTQAAAKELSGNARAPSPVTQIPAPVALETATDVVDSQAPLMRPFAELKTEPGRRTELPLTSRPVVRDGAGSFARETLPTAIAPGSVPTELVPDTQREDSALRLSGLQQVAQNVAQQFSAQQQPAQPLQGAPVQWQPMVAETATSTLPAQAALIDTPVADSAWGERLGERVLLMAGNQLRSAEIRLTPAELGPVRVQVAVDDGTANITFHAQHAVTREAIEQALPRLREMLVDNGLTLGQASVGEQGVAGHGNTNRDGSADALGFTADSDENGAQTDSEAATADAPTRVSNGLVDTFV